MKFIVNKDRFKIDEAVENVSGSIAYYSIEVDFDETWDGLTKEVILIKKGEDEGIKRAVVDGKILIDVKFRGIYSVGFVGYTLNENNEKNLQISTELKNILFAKGAGEVETTEIEVPSASEWEIYISQINEVVDEASKVNIDIIKENEQIKVIVTNRNGETKEAIVSGGSEGTKKHNELENLDYESSGHIGFQKEIEDLEEIRAGAEKGATAVQDEDYVHTDNNYTDVEKTKLAELENYDDSEIKSEISNKQNKLTSENAGSNVTITEVDGIVKISSTGVGSLPKYPIFDVTKQYVLILTSNKEQTDYDLKWKEIISVESSQLVTSDNLIFKTVNNENFVLKEEI